MQSKQTTFTHLLANLDKDSTKVHVYQLTSTTSQQLDTNKSLSLYTLDSKYDLQESKTYLVDRLTDDYSQVFPSLWPTDVPSSGSGWPDFVGRVGPFATVDSFRSVSKCQILRKVKVNGTPVMVRYVSSLQAWVMRVGGKSVSFRSLQELEETASKE